ncbi:hypothetical protein [Novacetimonas hansenii]|uniref:hypothetical protein n=1 Tax=Novacetimonas hansenii TaxID=436 RepID=UPI001144D96D|nr:hypothetical protein [Novacetimonas hansenii]
MLAPQGTASGHCHGCRQYPGYGASRQGIFENTLLIRNDKIPAYVFFQKGDVVQNIPRKAWTGMFMMSVGGCILPFQNVPDICQDVGRTIKNRQPHSHSHSHSHSHRTGPTQA